MEDARSIFLRNLDEAFIICCREMVEVVLTAFSVSF